MPKQPSLYFAENLYSEYYNKQKPRNLLSLRIPDFPHSLVVLGGAEHLSYNTDRFGSWEHYEHKFDPIYAPVILGDPYRRFIILYGNLDITTQGIVGRKEFPYKLFYEKSGG